MNNIKRYVIKIGGESGQGINSIGEILGKSLKECGFYTFGYREYPSLIKGGYASYQLDFSDLHIHSSSRYTNLLVCISRVSAYKYLRSLAQNGILIHNLKLLNFSEEDQKFIQEKNIKVLYVDTEKLLTEINAKKIMANTILLGMICGFLNINLEIVNTILAKIINKSQEILDQNKECLKVGYSQIENQGMERFQNPFAADETIKNGYLIAGNDAIGLGSYAAGVRAYFAYPMTPSSSILTFLSEIKNETKMLVRQVDDEITAAEMMIGSMFMGTRALTATSGGGFDLMTESVSLAGMTETPSVFILGQRPGPATGLPTWTAQGDLNLAIYSGHGEYTRCVLSISNSADAYLIIQKAFNIAEKFQIPVIVLTEKQTSESLYFVKNFDKNIPIERFLADPIDLKSSDRYAITENGISKRWLPGQSESTFNGNSDEHLPDGSLTEESQHVIDIYSKRMRKLETLKSELPQPELFGDENPEILFVGFGSVKNTVLDYMNISDKKISYLHYEYVYPLRTERFLELSQKASRVVIIENNYLSQLGNLITQETGFMFKDKLLKFDGRPFFIEDIFEYIEESSPRIVQISDKLKSLINI